MYLSKEINSFRKWKTCLKSYFNLPDRLQIQLTEASWHERNLDVFVTYGNWWPIRFQKSKFQTALMKETLGIDNKVFRKGISLNSVIRDKIREWFVYQSYIVNLTTDILSKKKFIFLTILRSGIRCNKPLTIDNYKVEWKNSFYFFFWKFVYCKV